MADQTWDPNGKIFLITGGASGLGAQYAEAFSKEGARAVVIVDIAEKAGVAKAAELNQVYPGRVIFMKCDVSKEDEIERTFAEVVAQFQRVDVIINNAGIMDDSPSMWRTACDVNWQGVVSFTMRAVKHMRKDEGGVGGTIVNVSSTAALLKYPFFSIYRGAKMGVLHFSQCLAVEPFFVDTGIRILTMCFGPTDTALLQGLEHRTYHEKQGKEVKAAFSDTNTTLQRVESAVAAMVHIVKNGPPASIWLSLNNKPVQDITPIIDNFFNDLDKIAN